jgi:hypothetical protein
MRSALARRYAPLAAVLAVQLAIIAIVPSKPSTPAGYDEYAGADNGSGAPVYDPKTGKYIDPETGKVVGSGGGKGGFSGSGSASASGGGSASGSGGPTSATGGGSAQLPPGATPTNGPPDMSHCKGAKQHDITYYAPPCVPKWGGGDNGGATYTGVTDKEIKVIVYNSKADPAVDQLLKGVDLSSSNAEEEAFRAAAEKFINAHYEFYGRTLKLETYNGTCDLLPPLPECFRNEMKEIVDKTHPFFVIWNTPLASAAFDELSKRGVPNAGGHHFSDTFSTQRRPFHYDWRMSGTRVARYLAEYWCSRMAGGKAKYGADSPEDRPEEGGPMTLRTRKLGVITPIDPANTVVLNEFKGMVRNCGGGVRAVYQYAQDIDRAQEQRKAGISKMKAAGVSTLMCICDGIAPYFMVVTEDEDRYWPENIVPGTGGMDFDAVGRLYNGSTTWGRALGISTLPVLEAYANNDAARVWHAAGNSGNPPYNLAINDWAYYEMVANMIQMAGPDLNPGTLERGAFSLRYPSNNPLHDARSFAPGDYTEVDDIKEVYWSRTAASNLDGKPGTYLSQNNGRRYGPGQMPHTPAERPL